MKPRALAARRFRLLKSASLKQCRHLVGLAPWSRTITASVVKNDPILGVKGACPPALPPPLGREGVTRAHSTEIDYR